MADPVVGIVGAGTMGAGIAQVAALHGWTAVLRDLSVDRAREQLDGVAGRIERLVAKGRLEADAGAAARDRLRVAAEVADLAPASLVIEAVVEDLEVKVRVMQAVVEVVDSAAILATNTSSLSVTALGRAIRQAHRTAGMHFFNPAPIMKLVEVVPGAETDASVVERLVAISREWGKIPAIAADQPGFIVNHVARPYYLEAFRILEDGHARVEVIDRAMREIGGFRMGPFELTDLIGQDVNAATSRQVWGRLDRPALLEPSRLQEQLVTDGRLGRKTNHGLYDYEGVDPVPAIQVAPVEPPLDAPAADAFRELARAAAPDVDPDPRPAYVFARILVALLLQARAALDRDVASREDIDAALRYGANHPCGPFEWIDRLGRDRLERCREALAAMPGGARFMAGRLAAS